MNFCLGRPEANPLKSNLCFCLCPIGHRPEGLLQEKAKGVANGSSYREQGLVLYKVTIVYSGETRRNRKRWAISREYKNKIIIAASVKGLKEYAILNIAYVRH